MSRATNRVLAVLAFTIVSLVAEVVLAALLSPFGVGAVELLLIAPFAALAGWVAAKKVLGSLDQSPGRSHP